MAKTETQRMIATAVAACADKKAEYTRILELDPSDSGFTDFFLITSGNSGRQVVAISDEIEIRIKREFGTYPNAVEGRRQGEWVLMDYVDFVVHIFVAEKRAYYDIERLRKSATSVDIEDLKRALSAKVKEARKKKPVSAKKTVAKKSVVQKAGASVAVKKKNAAKKAITAKKTARKSAKKAEK